MVNRISWQTDYLKDIANTYQFKQLITGHTRITESSATLIDLAFTNKSESIVTSGIEHVGISDHSLIYIQRKIAIPRKQPKITVTRQYKNYQVAAFKNDLSKILASLKDTDDPNIMWEDWRAKFLAGADIHAPYVTRKVRNDYVPWITAEIKRSIHHRDFLKKKAVKTKSKFTHEAYKKARNEVNKLIKHTKATYYMNAFNDCESNPKEMWRKISDLTNKRAKTTNISEVAEEGVILTDPTEIANSFNKFFSEIGPNLSDKLPNSNYAPESYVKSINDDFHFRTITESEVLKLLSTLKTSKATGHDKISPKLLKDSADIITKSLTQIFNKSILVGKFPDDLKIAIISPIYKTGNKTNYRPISVLSVVAKIFEAIISHQLSNYLEINGVIVNEQFGFRKKHSTQTALLNVTNKWYLNMDKGYLNGVIFLDLKKAFDCVNHSILLKKLQCYGINGVAYTWFKSYLTDRMQTCKIGQNKSQQHKIRCGVPQGSNLGPLLFLLYINDLPNCLSYTSANMFADDTNITTKGLNVEEIQTRLNYDLEHIHQWLLANKLTLNKDKTEYMIIGSRQRLSNIEIDPTIELGESKIKRVKHSKTLGIIIDDQLLWKKQVETTVSKVSKGIGMLRRIKSCVPKRTLIKVYNAIILPHFDYCSLVWSNCSEYLLDKLQKRQNRAARIITGRPYDIPTKEIFRELNWQSLPDRWEKNKLMFMHKVKSNDLPASMNNLFQIANNTNYDLRSNGNDFLLQKPKTNYMKKSITYNGAIAWNKLPNNVKAANMSTSQFKAVLDRK